MNKIDQLRIREMRKLISSNEEKIIVDIGGGLNPMCKGINFKKKIIIDGDASFKPDILMDLNQKIKLKDDSVDIVVAGEILEHLINPFKFLLEIKRILKKNGELILSTPNIACLKSRIKMIFGKLPTNCAKAFATKEDTLFFHKVDFNWDSLKELIEKAGFKIIYKQHTGIFMKKTLLLSPRYCPFELGEKFIVKAIK